MKSQVLHTIWCNISGEAAGEIWNWSLWEWKGNAKCLSITCLANGFSLSEEQRRFVWMIGVGEGPKFYYPPCGNACQIGKSSSSSLTGSILKCVTEHPGFSFQVFDKLWPECQRLNSHQRDVVMRRRCLPGKAELSMDIVSWGKPPTVVHSAKLPRQYWNRTSASRNCHQRRCSAREQEVPPSSYSHTEQRRLWDSIAWVSNIRPSCGWNVQCWSDWRHCSQNKVHVFLRQLARRIFAPEVRVSLQVQVWAE